MPEELIVLHDQGLDAASEGASTCNPQFANESLNSASAFYAHSKVCAKDTQQQYAAITGYYQQLPFIVASVGDHESCALAQQQFLSVVVDMLPGLTKKLQVVDKAAAQKHFLEQLFALRKELPTFNAGFAMIVSFVDRDKQRKMLSFACPGICLIADSPANALENRSLFSAPTALQVMHDREHSNLSRKFNYHKYTPGEVLIACSQQVGSNQLPNPNFDANSYGVALVKSQPAQGFIACIVCPLSGQYPSIERDWQAECKPEVRRRYSINGNTRCSFFNHNPQLAVAISILSDNSKILQGIPPAKEALDQRDEGKVEMVIKAITNVSKQYEASYHPEIHHIAHLLLTAAKLRFNSLTSQHQRRGCLFDWDEYSKAINVVLNSKECFSEMTGNISATLQRYWHASLYALFDNIYALALLAQGQEQETFLLKQRHAFATRDDFFCFWSVDGVRRQTYERRYRDAVQMLNANVNKLQALLEELQQDLPDNEFDLVKRWQRYCYRRRCVYELPATRLVVT